MKSICLLFFLTLFFSSFSQQNITIEKKIKRFENAIRDLHLLGFNNDFTKDDAIEYILQTKDSLAVNCPIFLSQDKINIITNSLSNWISTHDREYKDFILFLETYNRKYY